MNRYKGLLIVVSFILISVFVASVGGLSLVQRGLSVKQEAPQNDSVVAGLADVAYKESEKVRVKLVFEDGEREFEIEHKEGETAYGVLEGLKEAGEIELQVKNYDFGVFVQEIDGHESTAEKAWIYYVNGEAGDVAADQLMLSSGDLVEWKFEEVRY